ncbi:MAG: hypothetical protein H7Z10_09150 [Gemmatimonadaceae bacterium]|nr:hypothetical protein [Acetobacteraceae bacterium]
MVSRLDLARASLVAGLAIGLLSWRESVGHIGDGDFLVPGYAPGATHAWYHVFREACGDVAKMAVLLLVFFGSERWRTPVTWWVSLILMLGYYAPFWIGAPALPALSAPNAIAEAIHIGMAFFALLGLALARPGFHTAGLPARPA